MTDTDPRTQAVRADHEQGYACPLDGLSEADCQIVQLAPPNITRWGILIHAANYPNEVEGCIAPGLARAGKSLTN